MLRFGNKLEGVARGALVTEPNTVLCWALAKLREAQAPPLQVVRAPKSKESLIFDLSPFRSPRNQEITTLAANVIQLDRVLRRFGPDADDEREMLRNYMTMKLKDLFPQGRAKPVLENPKTIVLFEELEDRLSAMEGHSPHQRWLLSRALALASDTAEVRWLLIEQDVIGIPVPVLIVVLFWLCLLFMSFGLFSPRNATVTVALFLCALAAAGAVQTTLDLSRPFEGIVRVSDKPLRHALNVIKHG